MKAVGRVRGRRGPHRGGSVQPGPLRYRDDGWVSNSLAAAAFTAIFITIMAVLSPMGAALWSVLTRGRA